MPRSDEIVGSVVDLGPNRMYTVRLAGGGVVSAHVSGDVQMQIVRLIPGDRVAVELSERDPSRARIVRKLQATKETGR